MACDTELKAPVSILLSTGPAVHLSGHRTWSRVLTSIHRPTGSQHLDLSGPPGGGPQLQ